MIRLSLEQRKNYIIKVAEKVFCEKGYREASMQDVADKASISKAGIYYYFKKKNDILSYISFERMNIFFEKLIGSVKESKEKRLDQREVFNQLIEAYARHMISARDGRIILIRERYHLTKEYREKLLKKERMVFALIRKELLKIKNLERKLDPNLTTFAIIGMLNLLSDWFKDEEHLDIETVIKQINWIIYHGILKD